MHVGHTEAEFGARFASGDWAQVGGPLQSIGFAIAGVHALQRAASHLLPRLAAPGSRMLDYGCATGDGTAVLAASFPLATVGGCDIAISAVQDARRRWPTLTFLRDDIEHPTQTATTIWTSHTLEHLADPAAVIRGLRRRCQFLVAIFPPICEPPASGPHMGAPLFTDWFPTLEAPVVLEAFATRRRDTALTTDAGVAVCEEPSLCCVWEGL